MSLVECTIRRILITENQGAQVVVLSEKDGARSFSICIGIFEAMAINRHVTGEVTQRPLTHELLSATIEALGGSLSSVAITDVRDGTFYGLLQLESADGGTVEVDCRPSDALALASLMECAIFVSEHVLDEASE